MIPFTLRIDEDLKKELEKIAYEEKRSLNMMINIILENYVKEKKEENEKK